MQVLSMLSEDAAEREMLAHLKEKGETDIFAANAYINEAYRVIDASEAADFGLKSLQRWPNSTTVLYQTHRTLMWAGRFSEASGLAARYNSLVPGGNALVSGREACATGDREAAEAILLELQEDPVQNLSEIWLMHNMLGNTEQETEVLRPLEQSGVLFELATFLNYPKFDARPFPELMAILARERVERPPPPEPPFRCPPAK